jgi:hypothetical protein
MPVVLNCENIKDNDTDTLVVPSIYLECIQENLGKSRLAKCTSPQRSVYSIIIKEINSNTDTVDHVLNKGQRQK